MVFFNKRSPSPVPICFDVFVLFCKTVSVNYSLADSFLESGWHFLKHFFNYHIFIVHNNNLLLGNRFRFLVLLIIEFGNGFRRKLEDGYVSFCGKKQ